MYDKIPVLIRNVSFGLEQDIDYVPAAGDAESFYNNLSGDDGSKGDPSMA